MIGLAGGNGTDGGQTHVVAAADWTDSCDGQALAIGGATLYRPSVGSRLRFNVGTGARALAVRCGASHVYDSPYESFSDLGVLVDGVWTSSIQVRTANALLMREVALDGDPHVVEIVQGYQETNTTIADIKATCVHAVRSRGGSLTLLPEPSTDRRLVIYGDSVGTGSLGDPITRYGWPFILRGTFAGRITQWTHGGWQIGDDSVGDVDYTAWAARLIGAMGSATTREVWMEIGYNDTAEYLTTLYPIALRALLAADPLVKVYAMTMFRTGGTAYDAKRAAIRDAVEAVASSRVELVEGTDMMNDPAGLAADETHLNNTGGPIAAANIGAFLAA